MALVALACCCQTASCWREASNCTTLVAHASSTTSDEDESVYMAGNAQSIEINCHDNLIFIASSHYGHRRQRQRETRRVDFDGCSFTAGDCLVAVDHVANECNGLSTCQVSLDVQYLHSCNSHSDYLLIIYECIACKRSSSTSDFSKIVVLICLFIFIQPKRA